MKIFFVLAFALVSLFAEDCSNELLFRFFPEPFTVEVLQKEGLSKEKAEEIAKDLSNRDSDVIRLIEEAAAKMEQNPIQNPAMQEERIQLFRTAIETVYQNALKRAGVDPNLNALEEIQQMRLERFESCRREGNLPAR